MREANLAVASPGEGGVAEKSFLYESRVTCPVCRQEIKVTRVKQSRLPLVKRHTDFYEEYKGVDPNYYYIWVCSHCGYAAPEHTFDRLSPRDREAVAGALNGRRLKVDLGGERDFDKALNSFKLALYCTGLRREPHGLLGALYLRMAWLFRSRGGDEQEFLQKALEHFSLSYEQERGSRENLSQDALCYLLGELNRRLGRYEEAVRWFSRVANDRSARPALVKMARDQWQEAKVQSRAARGHPPGGGDSPVDAGS